MMMTMTMTMTMSHYDDDDDDDDDGDNINQQSSVLAHGPCRDCTLPCASGLREQVFSPQPSCAEPSCARNLRETPARGHACTNLLTYVEII